MNPKPSLSSFLLISTGILVLPRILKSFINVNVFTVLALLLCYFAYEFWWKRRNLPAGPVPWLVAGNMPSFISGINIDDLFQYWRSQFGGVFTVWIGPTPLVMVCDLQNIKKYFMQNADLFSNRWRNHVTDTFMGGANGVVQIDGEKWREQRRFALHVLRDFGVGRPLMEARIMEEVKGFVAYLREHETVEMHSHIAVCVGNIINNMLFGVTFSQDSIEMHRLHGLLDQQSQLVVNPIMGLYIAAPFTTNIPVLNSKWNELMGIRNKLWAFLDVQIQDHISRLETGNRGEDDFTYSYMEELERRRAEGDDVGHFDEWQMKMLLLDLFFAGMETTVTTLKWAFLLITKHPEVQRKVQEELDYHCSEKWVTLADRPRLNYTNATINEIQRHANILPINLLRTTADDVEMDGYKYPKGTLVIPQISILMQDPTIFPEPKSFKPERFLGSDGKLLRIDEFMPFSIGKRQCLGESLARAELFLIFTNLLKHFDFTPSGSLETRRILGLTVSPPKYSCNVEERKFDANQNRIYPDAKASN